MRKIKTIHFWTSHPWKDSAYWNHWFGLDNLNFVYTDENPEYILATEQIYSSRVEMKRFLSFNQKHIKIFIGGEAISPDFNLFDYACTVDKGLILKDRVIRKTPILFFDRHIFFPLNKGCEDPEQELQQKDKFCNFIYSNANAHHRRDELFHVLSSYKKVDSLGRHLNNVGTSEHSLSREWRREIIDLKRPYKFSIAAENACFDGYVTEKIMSSLQARTIPIYWGDPSVAEEFNPKAFINANKMTDEELLNVVQTLDSDDAAWCSMISEPAITEAQQENLLRETSEFKTFFSKVFDDCPMLEKKRAPAGFWNDVYTKSFVDRSRYDLCDMKHVAIRKISKLKDALLHRKSPIGSFQ